jgi:hypothetical protein
LPLISPIDVEQILQERLENSLYAFNNQPIIWVDPILSRTNEISQNPNENLDKRVELSEIVNNPKSFIIKAPPQFGLTSLSHYLIKSAWTENKQIWVYVNSEEIKPHKIEKHVSDEVRMLGFQTNDIQCLILDS